MKCSALMLVILVTACGNKKTEEAPTAQAEAPAPAPEPAPAAAEAPKVIDTVKPPVMDELAKHMQAGDELEKQGKWSEALAEFELAAKARPTDAAALGEVGWTAWHANNLPRAREASEAMLEAAGQDAKLRGIALFNLGLAVESTLPSAAASLYAASNAVRSNATVKARLAKIVRDEPTKVREATPEGTALLAKVKVEPVKLPAKRKPSTAVDEGMLTALAATSVEWQGAAGKAVAVLDNVVCTEDAAHTFACTSPALSGDVAKALVQNLVARKIGGTKEGDHTTYKVAQIRCVSFDVETENGQLPADACDVTK
jgi:hypothetical protein